jgi:hypothetical protein
LDFLLRFGGYQDKAEFNTTVIDFVIVFEAFFELPITDSPIGGTRR